MSGVNKVILIGRLGADPELRNTQAGAVVSTMSLATSESWEKNGKKEEKTEWHRVVLWGKMAELASKYLKKGRMVYIEGKLQTRSWTDPQGQKRFNTEVVGTSMQFVDGGGQGGGASAPAPEDGSSFYASQGYEANHRGSDQFAPNFDDDIPF